MFINEKDEMVRERQWLLTLAKNYRSNQKIIFRPLTQQCDCPFIVQVKPLQIVSFGNSPCEPPLSYLLEINIFLFFLVLEITDSSLNFIHKLCQRWTQVRTSLRPKQKIFQQCTFRLNPRAASSYSFTTNTQDFSQNHP